jgi:glycosyltransferase involved in cell wall biosynthesis
LRKKKTAFLYPSQATREVWRREGFDGRQYYWSGISAHDETIQFPRAQRSDKKRRILSVGTSGPRKGTRALIESFAYACKKGLIPPEAELVLVAVQKPSKDPQVRDFILRTLSPEIQGRVHLVGVLQPPALHSYYATAEVYVQSSNMECLPLTLLTAMAYGLPIVTTDVDGCKEAIIDGVSGITVPPRRIELMAEALAEIFASPQLARKFGEAARERFREKFSLEATVEPLLRLLFPLDFATSHEESEPRGIFLSAEHAAEAREDINASGG